MLVRVQFKTATDGMYTMQVKTAKASRSNVAYIHTKQFQIQEHGADSHSAAVPSVRPALLDDALL